MPCSVALIMPVLNEEFSVAQTLNSVFASTRLPDEIIIADGRSTDHTRVEIEKFRHFGVPIHIIDNPQVYAGAGRNQAVAICQSDVVLLLDFGNTVAPDWIEKMCQPFDENPELGFVSGTFKPSVKTDFEHCVANIHYHLNVLLDKVPLEDLFRHLPAKPIPGALSLAVKRQAWDLLGGMPDWLRACEDNLFGRLLIANNVAYELVPDARQYHHMRNSVGQLYQQLHTYSKGNGHTGFLNQHVKKLLLMLAGITAVCVWLPLSLAAPTLIVLLLCYLYQTGIKKVIKVDGRLKKWRYIVLGSAVVVARDLGTLTGHAAGIFDWLTKPVYRLRYKQYFKLLAL